MWKTKTNFYEILQRPLTGGVNFFMNFFDNNFSKSVQTRSDPSGGGGLTSPRGITAARPPFFILRFEARPLGFIDIGDLKRLRCLLEQ